MAFEIPIRRIEGLPNAIQVGFAIRRPRRTVSGGLSRQGHAGQEKDAHSETRKDHVSEPVSHFMPHKSSSPFCKPLRYFGFRGAGLPNFASLTGTFVFISLSTIESRPSSQA